MRGTMNLFRAFGIPIRMHWTFLAFFPFLVWYVSSSQEQSLLWGTILYVLLFACVVLHELAHSLVARRFGLKVREIVLLPIGGVASMERIPEEPGREAAIAIAGPAFNLAVALALFIFMDRLPGIMFNLGAIWQNETPFTRGSVAIFQVNVIMAVFNLIPAFPMDGGRLLRAALVACKIPYIRATATAVVVSKVLLALFVVLGLFTQQWMLLAIAVVLYAGASSEEHMVRTRSNIRNIRAEHLLPQTPLTIEPGSTLGSVVPLLLSSGQTHFPVVKGGRLAGVLCHRDIVAGLKRDGGDELTARELMREPLLVSPDDALVEIQRRMEEQGITVACIVRAGRLVGLVSYDSLRRLAGLLDGNGG